MYSFDPYEWEQHYRRAVGPASRQVNRVLDRFEESLRDWLQAALNWPEENWRADLTRFLDHSRYAGVIVEPGGRAALESLLESRASEGGNFGEVARGQDFDTPIQLAAITFSNEEEDTDASVDYGPEPSDTEIKQELAGPGPAPSEAYQQKVRQILSILDEFVARIWQQKRGIVRSRERNFLQFRYYTEKEDARLVMVVSPEFTARDTAMAILSEAYASRANPINAEVREKKLLTAEEIEKEYAKLQTEAFQEAAGQAAFLAEFYVGSLASLTPAGELIVTLEDIDRNGFSWQHLFSALPLLKHLPFAVVAVSIKLGNGQRLKIPAPLLRQLNALSKAARAKIAKAVNLCKTPEEAIEKIKKLLATKSGTGKRRPPQPAPKPAKHPKSPKPAAPRKGPGRWIPPTSEMRARNRAYQVQICGRADEYYVDGVKFDGYKPGVLLEAKGPGHAHFIDKTGNLPYWYEGWTEIVAQARNQLRVAKGVPIEWHVAEKEFIPVLRRLFDAHGISGIKIIHVPVRP